MVQCPEEAKEAEETDPPSVGGRKEVFGDRLDICQSHRY
jgi:hypothetical protein